MIYVKSILLGVVAALVTAVLWVDRGGGAGRLRGWFLLAVSPIFKAPDSSTLNLPAPALV